MEREVRKRLKRKQRNGVRYSKEFSVFVGNLPSELGQYGLRGIFKKAGNVCDVYIPMIRKLKSRFVFVRFHKEDEASKSIQMLHGAIVRGYRLIVARAKPKRRYKWKGMFEGQRRRAPDLRKVHKEWRRKEPAHDLDRFIKEDQPLEVELLGEQNDEFAEWLGRSLVCTAEEPRDHATLDQPSLMV